MSEQSQLMIDGRISFVWRVLTYAATGFLLWTFAAWLAAEALVVRARLGRADAIVVLSGSYSFEERTERAAELYRLRVAPLVILTNDGEQGGWSSSEQRNPYFYERARDHLIRSGVPHQSIEVIYQPVWSTYSEALEVRNFVHKRQLRSLLFVTSGYHSRRALWTLRKVFTGSAIEIGLEPVQPGLQTPFPGTWWLHQRGWSTVMGEYGKALYYSWILLPA